MSVLEKRSSSSVEPVGAASGLGIGLMFAPGLAWMLATIGSHVPLLPGTMLFYIVAMAVVGIVLSFF